MKRHPRYVVEIDEPRPAGGAGRHRRAWPVVGGDWPGASRLAEAWAETQRRAGKKVLRVAAE